MWKNKNQHPQLLKKIIEAYERIDEPIYLSEEMKNAFVTEAKILRMYSIADLWENVYKKRAEYSARLSGTDNSPDWLRAALLIPENEVAIEKILTLLIENYQRKQTTFGTQRHPFADFIDTYMEEAYRTVKDVSVIDRLGALYEKHIGNKWEYKPQNYRTPAPFGYVGTKLEDRCGSLCSVEKKEAEFWYRVAKLFVPDYEMPRVRDLSKEYLAAKGTAATVSSQSPLAAADLGYTSSSAAETDRGFVMDELLSAYYSDFSATAEAAAIGNDWIDLAYMGFFDDTSWQ